MAKDESPELLIAEFQIEKLLNQGRHILVIHTFKLSPHFFCWFLLDARTMSGHNVTWNTIAFQMRLSNLCTDQNGRRIAILGTIGAQPGILIAERAAFATESLEALRAFHAAIMQVRNLGDNDIYRWYMALSGQVGGQIPLPDLKLNLIWPCTDQHIKKYSAQFVRMVTETSEVYRNYVMPYMRLKREEGRLNWVFNILEGRTEQEDVILRDTNHGPEHGFLMLPDLNWDRRTMNSLHLLAIVDRRDIWSLRDLKKRHIPWLRYLRKRLLEATVGMFPGLEQDQLKLYVHCKYKIGFF
jgi:m7GpppX diphosphatase